VAYQLAAVQPARRTISALAGVNGAALTRRCLAAEHCWDQARWAVEAYAWRFDGLGRAPGARGAA
ncbi:MAG TPA: hypothetical protein VFY87_21145, partial [Geminicoccaceae bacterium]|nr:hypothetical protein [Geminicoccaceae bacterium]